MSTQRDVTKRPLPDGWRWVRLGEVIREAQPGFACGERDPNGVIQLRMNNVDTRGNCVWDEFIRVPADASTIAKYSLRPGDVLFNNTNSVELVGKTALFTGYKEPVVYSNHFTVLRTRYEYLDAEYLARFLVWQWQTGVFQHVCNRWIGQSAVKNDKLLSIEIPLPPLSEQQRIAAVLREQMAAVERARRAAEEQLEAAKALPAAFLREVFPRLGEPLPDGWRWVRLGEVCEIIAGQSPPSETYRTFPEGLPFFQGKADFGFIHPLPRVWCTEPKVIAKPGDILISVRAPVGPTNIADIECCIGRGLAAIRPQKDVNRDFILLALKLSEPVLVKLGSGSTFQAIKREDLEGLEIPLPPLAEQQRIAAILRERMAAVEKIRTAIENQLKEINALPAALLRRAFEGGL